MSFERGHIPDEILFEYADDPQGVLDRAGVEAHLAACATCAARLADLAAFTAALREESTWWAAREIASGKQQSAIDAYSERLAREDGEAVRMLGDMLESQYLFVRANLARKRRLHTGGVVRLLTKTAHEECDCTPLFAVALAETAGIIAEALPDDYYPAGAVNILRGDAWIEYATACRHLGRFEEGLDGVARAERNYRRLLDPGMFFARAALARATLLWEQQKYDEALRFARDAAERFADRRATEGYAQAKEWEALILHRKGDVAAASETYSKVFAIADSISDMEMKARAARNLAIVFSGRGDIASAGDYLLVALNIYEDLGKRAMVVQTRWVIAELSLVAGHAAVAAERLPDLIAELMELGMSTDAALAQLDLAEALVVLNRLDEAREICAALVSFFRRADMLTGAVTAAAFLREAAAKRTITPKHIAYVREYLSALDRSPDLIFPPPPETR